MKHFLKIKTRRLAELGRGFEQLCLNCLASYGVANLGKNVVMVGPNRIKTQVSSIDTFHDLGCYL